ncbi:MAG: hypothetical protein QOE73_901, partial [Verrucomicrobiota bacterium]
MTTKRIRCTCGRVYDPVKHKRCPDCGAETIAANIAEPAPVALRETKQSSAPTNSEATPAPIRLPVPINARTMGMIGGGLFVLIVIVFLVRHSGSSEKSADVKHDRSGPAPALTATPPPPAAVIPPYSGGMEGADLAAMIAGAAPGATVKVPAGLYRGGLVVPRAIRLVADSKMGGQVLIQSEGKECLSVRAAGVSVQNIQFIGNGIGDL